MYMSTQAHTPGNSQPASSDSDMPCTIWCLHNMRRQQQARGRKNVADMGEQFDQLTAHFAEGEVNRAQTLNAEDRIKDSFLQTCTNPVT